MSTFICFGNSENIFERMIEYIHETIDLMPAPIVIQAGVNLSYFNVDLNPSVMIFDYCDNFVFENYIRNSSLIISHAGVGALGKAFTYLKYPVVFPRDPLFSEHIDSHQIELSEFLIKKNAIFTPSNVANLKKFLISKSYLKSNTAAISLFNNNNIKNDLHDYIYKILR